MKNSDTGHHFAVNPDAVIWGKKNVQGSEKVLEPGEKSSRGSHLSDTRSP